MLDFLWYTIAATLAGVGTGLVGFPAILLKRWQGNRCTPDYNGCAVDCPSLLGIY